MQCRGLRLTPPPPPHAGLLLTFTDSFSCVDNFVGMQKCCLACFLHENKVWLISGNFPCPYRRNNGKIKNRPRTEAMANAKCTCTPVRWARALLLMFWANCTNRFVQPWRFCGAVPTTHGFAHSAPFRHCEPPWGEPMQPTHGDTGRFHGDDPLVPGAGSRCASFPMQLNIGLEMQ